MLRKIINIILIVYGFLFLNAYIKSATIDVVYTDYIRIVNTYLIHPFSLKPYLSIDILTRAPINYIQRIINVLFFRYSTSFDMFLGIIFLSLIFIIILRFISIKRYNILVSVVLFILVFSLNKWEMLTNGTGWAHFLAVALFILHFFLFDKLRKTNKFNIDKRKNLEILIFILPIINILFIAGPYGVAYAVVINLAYFYDLYKEKFSKEAFIINIKRVMSVNIPIVLYFISSYFAIEEHAGATDKSFFDIVRDQGYIFPSFFIKSFASMIFSKEFIEYNNVSFIALYILGSIVILTYIFALYIGIKNKLYKRSIFPFMLLVYGFISHLLVTLSRWIFLNDTYGMSSRYALQYHIGIIGIVLILSYKKVLKTKLQKIISINIIVLFILANIVTTNKEINIAKYRKENFENMKVKALNFENETDEDLKKIFQYKSGEKTRQALSILKEKKLNVFR